VKIRDARGDFIRHEINLDAEANSSAIPRQLPLSPMMIFAIGIKYSLDVVI
jgi:hypothetical protein